MFTCTCVDRESDDHLPYDYMSFIVHADVYIHVHNVKNVFSQNTEENSFPCKQRANTHTILR